MEAPSLFFLRSILSICALITILLEMPIVISVDIQFSNREAHADPIATPQAVAKQQQWPWPEHQLHHQNEGHFLGLGNFHLPPQKLHQQTPPAVTVTDGLGVGVGVETRLGVGVNTAGIDAVDDDVVQVEAPSALPRTPFQIVINTEHDLCLSVGGANFGLLHRLRKTGHERKLVVEKCVSVSVDAAAALNADDGDGGGEGGEKQLWVLDGQSGNHEIRGYAPAYPGGMWFVTEYCICFTAKTIDGTLVQIAKLVSVDSECQQSMVDRQQPATQLVPAQDFTVVLAPARSRHQKRKNKNVPNRKTVSIRVIKEAKTKQKLAKEYGITPLRTNRMADSGLLMLPYSRTDAARVSVSLERAKADCIFKYDQRNQLIYDGFVSRHFNGIRGYKRQHGVLAKYNAKESEQKSGKQRQQQQQEVVIAEIITDGRKGNSCLYVARK